MLVFCPTCWVEYISKPYTLGTTGMRAKVRALRAAGSCEARSENDLLLVFSPPVDAGLRLGQWVG